MKEYKTINKIAGPLLFVEKTEPVGYKEFVTVTLSNGETKRGQVLETSKDYVIVQVFEDTQGIDKQTYVHFSGEIIQMPVSGKMLGRVLSGIGTPLDGGRKIIPEDKRNIQGEVINPYSRTRPNEFIQTGISTIDGMNTLVRGQKLPLFSGSGLPHNEIALQIARQATVTGEEESFAVVFCAIGITQEEAKQFINEFERTGALQRGVVFLNLASDPSIERIITPRMALTTAEFLAFDYGYHVLTILTDMTNYCEALLEIGAAREEVPGRRGYPGYLYTDLASIYERAGLIKGKSGSVTQLPILTMPGDDKTHPVPDLSGYITEGQIFVSRNLYRKNVYPPIDVLPSLSRLMNSGIGKGKTRADHKALSDQLYAGYAEGLDLRGLATIVGKDALTSRDQRLLSFADTFEKRFVMQGRDENRPIETTLELGWDILSTLPEDELTRIPGDMLEAYYRRETTADEGD
ncbi:V-type ATP synthase subunit B [archaeon]|nr:MAG: V-type ATP synthase subunit B [archaeon]